MPIENQQDALDVDAYIDRIFEASSTQERKHAITNLFAEKLDFVPIVFDQFVELKDKAPGNVQLPRVAYIVAELEDAHVLYIDLAESDISTDRVRKAEASVAADLIYREIDGDPLLVFTNRRNSQLHFIFPSFEGLQPVLRRMIIERDLPRRTAIQQISNIYWEYQDKGSIHPALNSAFDVEAVTNAFFKEYKRIFDSSFEKISGFGDSEEELKHKELYILTLFNRLMFIYFVSRKGWMRFRNDNDYLNALWMDYESDPTQSNFYNDRLAHLFFGGLNIPDARHLKKKDPMLYSKIGDVPFLNGGLFQKSDLDRVEHDIQVPDDAIEPIFKELFDKFNFTVMESTPLDIGVAVDPEMLGKVFEELVTERHESGAYYTPRPVVSFMCREALKGYLTAHNKDIDSTAISEFVDTRDTSKISLSDARELSHHLYSIKVVDPACGSGAYLLGMLQELVELHMALYDHKLKLDGPGLYRLKLKIIEDNLHGVDNDPFAVNIAMLRLWLALAIEFEPDDEHDDPDALPNLDFKIVCGDSLLGIDPGQNNLDRELIRKSNLNALKSQFMEETDPRHKDILKHKISDVEDQLKSERGDAILPNGVVDWLIDFAEVFGPNKGFDVVVANPPYVNVFKIDSNRPGYRSKLMDIYQTAYKRFDLFVPFMERGISLLAEGGMFAFITPNKYLSTEYATKLRRFMKDNITLQSLSDLSNVPVFDASVYPVITLAQRSEVDHDDTEVDIFVAELDSEGDTVVHLRDSVPMSLTGYLDNNWSPLLHPSTLDLLPILTHTHTLSDVADVIPAAWVNEAYDLKDALVDDAFDLATSEPTRFVPFIVSGNIRQYEHTWRDSPVRYMKTKYNMPVLDLNHPTVSDKRQTQVKSPKIITSGMIKMPTCVWDDRGIASGVSTTYIFPHSDVSGLYLTAIINSQLMSQVYEIMYGSLALAGGYMRMGAPQLKRLPIPDASSSDQTEISDLVKLLINCANNDRPSIIERIESRVRSLFGL